MLTKECDSPSLVLQAIGVSVAVADPLLLLHDSAVLYSHLILYTLLSCVNSGLAIVPRLQIGYIQGNIPCIPSKAMG